MFEETSNSIYSFLELTLASSKLYQTAIFRPWSLDNFFSVSTESFVEVK